MANVSMREELLDAAKSLLWERGFESTSPAAILERSGAGQGSLYHHFRGKNDLAATALAEVADELSAAGKKLLEREGDPLRNVVAYLEMSRPALRGCRLGRFAGESSVLATPELLAPVRSYFASICDAIANALERAQRAGTFDGAADPRDTAVALVAIVQGGYVLSRVFSDASYLERATKAAVRMLSRYAVRAKRKAE